MTERIVFADCETVHLVPGPLTIWELALIVREAGEPDRELVWHIRPDLSDPLRAAGAAANIGGYYQRCRALRLAPGDGVLTRDTSDLADLGAHPLNVTGRHIAGTVADLLAGAVVAGANAGSFDAPHVDAYLRGQGELLAADYHFLDLGSLVLGWVHGLGNRPEPGRRLKLTDCVRLAGLDASGYTAHEALSDARAARDVFDVVTGGTP